MMQIANKVPNNDYDRVDYAEIEVRQLARKYQHKVTEIAPECRNLINALFPSSKPGQHFHALLAANLIRLHSAKSLSEIEELQGALPSFISFLKNTPERIETLERISDLSEALEKFKRDFNL